jgi:hypothetical protein
VQPSTNKHFNPLNDSDNKMDDLDETDNYDELDNSDELIKY